MNVKLFLILFFLAGCVSASQIMGEFVGQDVTKAIVKYGPPANVFDLPDGRRAFQWRISSSIIMPQTTNYSATGYGNTVFGTATTTGGYLGDQVCFYTLYGQKNKNRSWTVVGFEQPTMMC